jgi:hypothetical protein
MPYGFEQAFAGDCPQFQSEAADKTSQRIPFHKVPDHQTRHYKANRKVTISRTVRHAADPHGISSVN